MKQEVIERVVIMIKDALTFLPEGCRISAGIVFCMLLLGLGWKCLLHKPVKLTFWFRLPAFFAFFAYMYCLLQCTILSREPGIFGGIDWRFLVLWDSGVGEKAWFLGNIVMFIPFGVLLPMLGKALKHILVSFPVASASSIFIEYVQLKRQLGHCQLDDVAANSTGFLVGFLIFMALYDLFLLVQFLVKCVCKGKFKIKQSKSIDSIRAYLKKLNKVSKKKEYKEGK